MSRRLPLASLLAAGVVVVIAVVATILSSGGGDRQSSSSTSAGPSRRLAPATSTYPAAGVCGRTTGAVLVVRIEPDAPDPRCASVDADQRLRVVNNTGDFGQPPHTVTVTWVPGQRFTLRPGEARTFQRQFGTYLARGVHDLSVQSGYRAEIWLH
ncbi:MAG TPA: hypothetical protein VGK78_00900 [Nocardioides sp.]|uniref:hypothetical protein n=1 Tax=Nocardioides sp. TaxID=35761 RepID=UPI002F4199C2